MAAPYDDYRIGGPSAQPSPFTANGIPVQGMTESSSLWGNLTSGGNRGATEGARSGFLPAAATGYVAGMAGGFRNAGRAKEARRQAEERQREAVRQWRIATSRNMQEMLGQSGSDVRRDLGGELDQALAVGGEYGDQNAINDSMAQFQQRYQQYMLGRQRATQARQVDAMFSDPRRASDRAKRLDAARQQGQGQIAEGYRIGNRNNSFNQARRGTMGSSMDVEQRGELGRGRDQAAMNLQSGLDARAQQYRLNDQQQRNTLMGMIYADDPNTAAALGRTIEGIGQEGALIQENEAIRAQGEALRRGASQDYSRAIGGGLTAASRPLEYYLGNSGGA